MRTATPVARAPGVAASPAGMPRSHRFLPAAGLSKLPPACSAHTHVYTLTVRLLLHRSPRILWHTAVPGVFPSVRVTLMDTQWGRLCGTLTFR